MGKWLTIATLSTLTCLSAIAVTPKSSLARFQRLRIEEVQPCHWTLPRLRDIPHQCWKFLDGGARLPVWETSIGFSFGKLTQAQWQQIAIAYGAWREGGLAPFDPQKDYWLMDFMPPLMQALNRNRFELQTRRLNFRRNKGASPQTLSVVANCWGTLYELLRLKNAPLNSQSYLFLAEANDMLQTLNSISERVETPQPGNFLLITHRHGDRIFLDHGALFIDEHLVFEKAGVGDTVPYRLIDMDTIRQIWRPDVFDYEIRRPTLTATLPHPFIFGTRREREPDEYSDEHHSTQEFWTTLSSEDETTPSYFSILPLPSLIEVNGTIQLPAKAYDDSYFQREIP